MTRAAAAVPSGPGTIVKQTYTVAPVAVPKLGLQGMQCETGRAQGLSQKGQDILECYTRQLATARTWREAPAPTEQPTAALTQREHTPHSEILPLPLQASAAAHRHPRAALENGDAAAEWGAWMPNTRHKPALLRINAHRPTSPRLHSPGPDVKTAISASAIRRLRPSTANDGRSFPASNSGNAFLRKNSASRSNEGRSPHSTPRRISTPVAAWTPIPDLGFDDLPQLFIKPMFPHHGMMPKSPLGPGAKGRVDVDSVSGSPVDGAWLDLSMEDKHLLSMYRQMAGSGQTEAPRTPRASITNVELLPEKSISDPAQGTGSRGASLKKNRKGTKESPVGPMAIGSYSLPATPAKPQQANIEISIPGLDGMKEWRDKQSASRPSSASRPLTVSRPVSAKGRPSLRLHEELPRHAAEDPRDCALHLMVQGHQMDADRALYLAFEPLFDDITTGMDAGIHEDKKDSERQLTTSVGEPDAGANRKAPVDRPDFQIEPWLTVADGDASKMNVGSASSTLKSRAGSRPVSAGASRPTSASRAQVVRTPALIAAEQQLEEKQQQTEHTEQQHKRQLDQAQQQHPNEQLEEYVQEPQSAAHSLDSSEQAGFASGQHEEGVNRENDAAHVITRSTIKPGSSPMTAATVNMSDCQPGPPTAVTGSEHSHDLRSKGFVKCIHCNEDVPISLGKPQQQIVLKYIRESDQDPEHVSRTGSRSPIAGSRSPIAAVQARARPSSASSSAGELKDLRQQLYDMQQVCQREAMERAREQTQHLNALKSLNAALEETRAASKGAEEKLAAVQQKLAATELQLAQAPAQTQTQTDKTTDDSHSHTASCDVSPAPTSKPPSRPASGRQKGASLKTAQAKETPGDGAKKEIAESTAPKVDAVEVQNMMDAINDLKKKLESVSYTAAAAKGVHEADVKKKDDELKNLRAEMEKREQQAKTAHEAELRKLQGDLTKAKGEVQAMKKQRDAKLAIHERQALADAQDQLALDQEQLKREKEELRTAREAAQKDIDDGARVAALRDSLAITEQKLKAFEADLRSQEVQIVSDWQKLHDRQSALAQELEVSVGDVKHDKAVLLKELRLTLTENAELGVKCAALERELRGNGMGEKERGRNCLEDGATRGDGAAGGSRSSSMGSRSSSNAGAQIAQLPALNLGEQQADSGNSGVLRPSE